MVALASAYARCAEIAARHYENFPVASILVPRHARPHISAIYAFARGADDIADEGHADPEQRLESLRQWRGWLNDAAAGRSVEPAGPDEAIFVALADTIRQRDLPLELFEDLLSAFAQDVVVKSYSRWEYVLDYCRRSANPVGRLVLRVFGHEGPELERSSDGLCTALQLTNFWQDLARDWEAGRLYLPEELWAAAGATMETFDPAHLTPAWRSALRAATDRTWVLFDRGRAVCDAASGRLRHELRLTWLGGARILRAVERAEFDVAHQRPTLGLDDVPALLWGALTWPASADTASGRRTAPDHETAETRR